MSVQKNREFILKPLVEKEKLDDFLSKVSNVSLIYGDPSVITSKKFRTIFHSDNADFVVCDSLDLLWRQHLWIASGIVVMLIGYQLMRTRCRREEQRRNEGRRKAHVRNFRAVRGDGIHRFDLVSA